MQSPSPQAIRMFAPPSCSSMASASGMKPRTYAPITCTELAAGDPDTVLQLVEKIVVDDEELGERLYRSAIAAAASMKGS